MNNIGNNLITFNELIAQKNAIIIPKVQRDYAYGRDEDRPKKILSEILDEMINAVLNDTTTILDFVYGGPYVHRNNIDDGFIPLDGQQRLTTLFLLYYYASLLKDVTGSTVNRQNVENILLKFRYETRQSATEFCRHLITDIRDCLIKEYDPQKKNLKELIKDNSLYLSTYDNDPTISSMLNVLKVIEEKCIDQGCLNLTPSLWERLVGRRNIRFYCLALEKFGLTDDLYIKINARGKKLTQFDILKSDIVAAIKAVNDGLKDDFSGKMDNQWIDVIWHLTDKNEDDKRKAIDITNDADKKYLTLVQNVFRLEQYRHGLMINDNDMVDPGKVFTDESSIRSFMEILDVLYSIYSMPGFEQHWEQYFYTDDNTIGRSDSIRLFGQKKNSVFKSATEGPLSVPEMVYFYALYLLKKKSPSGDIAKKCLRVIRNLMTANVRNVDARTTKLHDFLIEVEYIIDHDGVIPYYSGSLMINGVDHKLVFVQNIWNEEHIKQAYFTPDDYQKLLKYENHNILNCSLLLFIDYCCNPYTSNPDYSTIDKRKLFGLLEKFEIIFDNNYQTRFDIIRIAFLDKDTEYMQYAPYMDIDPTQPMPQQTQRYFITEDYNLRSFFIKNQYRKNQDAIISILENKLPNTPTMLKDPLTKCAEFNKDDWRYYLAKYPEQSNRGGTRYGIELWDDQANYPLDLIILNSSQHSETNLEWMMMTHLLFKKLNNGQLYELRDHGCSPVLITSKSVTIEFLKTSWVIKPAGGLASDIQTQFQNEINNGGLILTQNGEEITVSIDFQKFALDLDYIELGLKLVEIIEKS